MGGAEIKKALEGTPNCPIKSLKAQEFQDRISEIDGAALSQETEIDI